MLFKSLNKFTLVLFVMVVLLSNATNVFAANEADPVDYYSKGWGKTTYLNSTSVGNDISDITVSAIYDKTLNEGVVRLRGFGHNTAVKNYYANQSPGWNWLVGVNKMTLWFGDNTTSHNPYWNVYNTNPGQSANQSADPIWWSVGYDILGLYAIQTNTLSAIINHLKQNGGGVTVDSQVNIARGVTQSAGSLQTFSSSRTELGTENPTSNPDTYTDNALKGLQALMNFKLPATETNYPVKAKNYIRYYVYQYQSSSYYYEWYPVTDAAIKTFYINAT